MWHRLLKPADGIETLLQALVGRIGIGCRCPAVFRDVTAMELVTIKGTIRDASLAETFEDSSFGFRFGMGISIG